MKHFSEPCWGLAEEEVKSLLPPLPDSLLSSKTDQRDILHKQVSPLRVSTWREQMQRDSSTALDERTNILEAVHSIVRAPWHFLSQTGATAR